MEGSGNSGGGGGSQKVAPKQKDTVVMVSRSEVIGWWVQIPTAGSTVVSDFVSRELGDT